MQADAERGALGASRSTLTGSYPMTHPYLPEAAELLLTYIEAGAYEQVAAEAAGISRADYRCWLARGQGKQACEPYRSFARSVRRARAQARAWAEIDVRKKDPRSWLKCGPGKEAPGRPGWSKEVGPQPTAVRPLGNLLDHPNWGRLWAQLLTVLADFPEARQRLADVLQCPAPPSA